MKLLNQKLYKVILDDKGNYAFATGKQINEHLENAYASVMRDKSTASKRQIDSKANQKINCYPRIEGSYVFFKKELNCGIFIILDFHRGFAFPNCNLP